MLSIKEEKKEKRRGLKTRILVRRKIKDNCLKIRISVLFSLDFLSSSSKLKRKSEAGRMSSHFLPSLVFLFCLLQPAFKKEVIWWKEKTKMILEIVLTL